jgi:acyl-CoA synthetase (NDP forming)
MQSLDGVHVQRMAPAGREVIIGVDRDPVFGPLLMFGLGGIYVEVLRDVTFRLCPVDRHEAERMITEIRSFGLLRGARGQPPADLDSVADAISAISAFVLDFPEIIELDINPLIVGTLARACGQQTYASGSEEPDGRLHCGIDTAIHRQERFRACAARHRR